MVEEIASQVVRLAGQTLGLPALVAVIVCLAIILVLLKRAGGMKLPPPAPAAPSPEDTPGSPPIQLRPDGSIPVANPVVPPEPLP